MIVSMTPVNSSNVAALGYEPVTRTLAVRFKSGQTYHYKDVPADVAGAVQAASSIGSAIAKLRGQYDAEKVSE